MPTGNFDISELKRRMQGATQALKHELGGLRTGRAAASMLEPVQVEAYGTHMPLNQLATVSVPEPRLLSVQVWDKSMVKAVEKAIVDSIGLSPAIEGQVFGANSGTPGAQELVTRQYAGAAKVAVRHVGATASLPSSSRNRKFRGRPGRLATTCRRRPTG